MRPELQLLLLLPPPTPARAPLPRQGVWEKDEERKHDSFVTFEEVFEIARRQEADFVLLGGDLFHDNKPSRHTVVRAMDILSRHCLGDRPVGFQVLSDQAANFAAGRVNFESPNLNVALPVFTIHGNHDDPAGAESLSAVDILSTANLLNYFGKARRGEEEEGEVGRGVGCPGFLETPSLAWLLGGPAAAP